jgi:hypothetical protein
LKQLSKIASTLRTKGYKTDILDFTLPTKIHTNITVAINDTLLTYSKPLILKPFEGCIKINTSKTIWIKAKGLTLKPLLDAIANLYLGADIALIHDRNNVHLQTLASILPLHVIPLYSYGAILIGEIEGNRPSDVKLCSKGMRQGRLQVLIAKRNAAPKHIGLIYAQQNLEPPLYERIRDYYDAIVIVYCQGSFYECMSTSLRVLEDSLLNSIDENARFSCIAYNGYPWPILLGSWGLLGCLHSVWKGLSAALMRMTVRLGVPKFQAAVYRSLRCLEKLLHEKSYVNILLPRLIIGRWLLVSGEGSVRLGFLPNVYPKSDNVLLVGVDTAISIAYEEALLDVLEAGLVESLELCGNR